MFPSGDPGVSGDFWVNLEGLGERRGVGMRWGRTIGSAGIWAGAPRWRGSSSGGPYNARSKNALHVSAASASSPSFASQSSLLGGLSTTDRAPPPWQRLLLLAQPADHPPGSREPGAPVTSRSSLPTAQGSFRDNTAITNEAQRQTPVQGYLEGYLIHTQRDP